MDKKRNKKNKKVNNNNNQNEEKDEEEYDILESVGIKSTFYNDQIQRYFAKYYINKGEPNEQYIFIHSNGIIVCGIGANNEILKKNISEITILKQPTKVTGRFKHGAYVLSPNEYVLKIKIDENNIINYCPKIKGRLIEVNQNLVKNPKLLIESPEKNGFVCIIILDADDLEKLKANLGKPDNLIIKY